MLMTFNKRAPNEPNSMKALRYLFLTLTLALATHVTHAGSATWDLNPTNNDWNTAANWTPATVPDSLTDVATFGVSNLTGISFSEMTTVGSIVFNPGGQCL